MALQRKYTHSSQDFFDDGLPLYGRRLPKSTFPTAVLCQTPPPPYEDVGFMRTVDRRHRFYQAAEQCPKYTRSSFALSDIFEADEGDIEIEILEVTLPASLPSASSSPAKSISLSSPLSVLVSSKKILRRVTSFTSTSSNQSQTSNGSTGILSRLMARLKRAGPHKVSNDGNKNGLDLLAC